MKLNVLMLAVLSAVMFTGCLSEQERLARAAAEKARQEQLAKEQAATKRAERISAISKSTRISYLVARVKADDEVEVRKAAVNRLLDIAKDPVSIVKTMQQPAYQVVEDRDKHERQRYSVKRRRDGMRGRDGQRRVVRGDSEKDLVELHARVKDEREQERAGFLISNLGRDDVLKELADVAKNCETAEIRNAVLEVIVLAMTHAAELANSPDEIENRKKRFLLRRRLGTSSTAEDKPCRESFQTCLADIVKNSRFLDVRIKAFESMEHDIPSLKEIESKSDDPALRAAAGKVIALKEVASCWDKNNLAKIAAEDKRSEVREAAQKKLKAMEELESATPKALDKHYEDLAEHNYNLALTVFDTDEWSFDRHYSSYMLKYKPDKKYDVKKDKPWQKMVGARKSLSEEEINEGVAKLEEFGTRYMPTAYSQYEKAHEQAEELQQMFNEEMPEPQKIKKDDPKWNAYSKLLKGLMKARTRAFRNHDELCHFYLMHKVGALSAADLAKMDSEKIAIRLYEENLDYICFTNAGVNAQSLTVLEEQARAFAEKQAPETYGLYQKCEDVRAESQKLLDELLADVRIMDITRFELPVVACREKIDFLTQTLNSLTADIQTWHVEYKTMDKDAEAIAALDHATALKWKGFVELLPDYLKNRSNGPMIAANSPMQNYYSCNIICHWHWFALGFHVISSYRGEENQTYDNNTAFANAESSGGSTIHIGEKLDQPTFITGMNERLFADMRKVQWGSKRDYSGRSEPIYRYAVNGQCEFEVSCWPFCDSYEHRLPFTNEISKDGFITMLFPVLFDPDWYLHNTGSGYYSERVYDTFKSDCVFLTRLNEVDNGKCSYLGISRAGIKYAENGRWMANHGWLIIKAE